MKPTRNRVLIKVDKAVDKTDTGIYLKEDWKSLPPTGTVVEIGPEVQNINKHDRVVFERYGSTIVEKDLRLCQDKHILAVINARNKTN